MRIGTTATVIGLTLVLAGCGSASTHRHTTDSLAADSLSATSADATVVSAGDPGTNPPAVADNASPKNNRDDKQVRPPIAPPSCPGGPTVHFATPEAAMTYLASAWNRNDLAALCQVTNPNARFLLQDMHKEAVNLRLMRCTREGVGAYQCIFRHEYPAHMHKKGTGRSWLEVAAADNPGWYMTVYEGCG